MAKVQDRVIRRLTVHFNSVDDGTIAMTSNSHLSQIRSLAIFGGSRGILSLQEFKLVRVLYLDICRREMKMDLTGIIQLAQLRYLKVENERSFGGISIELPALSACCIPPDIVDLPRLSHLVVPHDTGLTNGIGKVKCLRTLDGFSLPNSSVGNINGLRELTNLTDLSLHCHSLSSEYVTALRGTFSKLGGSLKRFSVSGSLNVSCADDMKGNMYRDLGWSPDFDLSFSLGFLSRLEVLDLSGCTFHQISWLRMLRNLRQLRLGVRQVLPEDIQLLGRLDLLVRLHLRMSALKERMVISGSMGFTKLEVFQLECDGISYLTFEAAAMPMLRTLWLAFDPSAWDKATTAGLQHLSSLKQIYVLTVRNNTATSGPQAPSTSLSETAEIRGPFQEASDSHPCRPEFTLGEGWLIRAMESWKTL